MKRRGRKKGYKMSDEQKQAIQKGLLNYYENMTDEQKARRERANKQLKEFWELYKNNQLKVIS